MAPAVALKGLIDMLDCLKKLHLRNLGGRAGLALLLVTCWVLPTAALANNMNYQLRLSEKEMHLAYPDDMHIAMMSMWDISIERILDRNMPFFALKNDPGSSEPIVGMHLTIGDDRFHFGDTFFGVFAKAGTMSPGLNISSHVENSGDDLYIEFNDGILPSEEVFFQVDIDVDAAYSSLFYALPDYRTVLFDMNGIDVYDNAPDFDGEGDNSNVWIEFDSMECGPVVFPDAVVEGNQANYYNNVYRPHGVMEGIDIFAVTGGVAIPEPSSAMLALMGIIGWVTTAWRRRRQLALVPVRTRAEAGR
jgi:PEP-CTERM motif